MKAIKLAVATVAMVGAMGSVGTAMAADVQTGGEERAQASGVDGTSQGEGASAYCWYETYCNVYGYCWTSWICF